MNVQDRRDTEAAKREDLEAGTLRAQNLLDRSKMDNWNDVPTMEYLEECGGDCPNDGQEYGAQEGQE